MEDYKLDISFPPLPSTVARVSKLIASRKTDTNALTDVVRRDPSITVNVLRRVNSAYYGIPREVEDIGQAVRLLGFVEVTSLTLIEGMNRMRNRFSPYPELFERILRAAVFTGRFTERLAEALDLSPQWRPLSFTSGVISETGRLILLHAAPKQYAELAETLEGPFPSAEQERNEFGESYREIAPRACERWGLPERICSVLQAATEPENVPEGVERSLAMVIRVGGTLARQDETGESLALPQDVREIAAVASESLVQTAAEDASAYAQEISSL